MVTFIATVKYQAKMVKGDVLLGDDPEEVSKETVDLMELDEDITKAIKKLAQKVATFNSQRMAVARIVNKSNSKTFTVQQQRIIHA